MTANFDAEKGNVEAWNSACLWRCPRGERPLVELYFEPGVFSEPPKKFTVIDKPYQLII